MSVLRAPVRIPVSDRYIDRIGEAGARAKPAPEPSLLDLAELEWEREIEKQRKQR